MNRPRIGSGSTARLAVDQSAGSTGAALSILDGETWTTHTTEDGLVHDDVRALAIAEDGAWVGAWSGLNYPVFDGKTD
ncbi:MAG: hypothetical protein PVH62_03280 [Anaerolineae bacterium]